MKTEIGLSESEGMKTGEQSHRSPGRPARASRLQLDMSDERLNDERGLHDRDSEDREYDEAERLEMFLETQHQTVLPNLPTMDGYHVCWLTTSNPRDSIQWRMSIGYQLVRIEECPGWQGITASTGNYSGVVSVNEMMAARIPITLYNKLMNAVGHTLPLREEEKLRQQSRQLRDQARERNIQVEEGDGTADIVQRAGPMPVFTE